MIRDAGIPYEVPAPEALSERLDAVVSVIYLVFNEGYSASGGTEVIRRDLSAEAIRLGRLLHELLPNPEDAGLLALMLFHDARPGGRTHANGESIALDEPQPHLCNLDQQHIRL